MSDGTRLGGVNARDIRMLLRGSIDPQLGKVLVGLAERQDHLYQLLITLATSFDKLATALLVQSTVSEHLMGMHQQIKEAKAMGVKVESSAAEDQNG